MNAITDLGHYLEETSTLHSHLCPRQVLGVRMGMFAARLLGLNLPQKDKRLFVFVETDGCFTDGVAVATGCGLGHRTMRLADYGKVAATFVDTHTGEAIRIAPSAQARDRAGCYAPDATSAWHAQLAAYQAMPDSELLTAQRVQLTVSMDALISRPGLRVNCAHCAEEIMNGREVTVEGQILCRPCAGQDMYFEVRG